MNNLLWKPSEKTIEEANIRRFVKMVNAEYNLSLETYSSLYDWSINNIPEFWEAVWKFGDIIYSRKYTTVVDDLSKFPGAAWFPGAKLNFAENLLRFRDDQLAFIFHGENRKSSQITYKELYKKVATLAAALRDFGVNPGDRVGGYMPNLPETAIAMLAATSLGAIWSSCGAELGSQAVLDRFGQIKPVILFAADGYFYKDRKFSNISKVEQIVNGLPSLQKTIIVPYVEKSLDISSIKNCVLEKEFRLSTSLTDQITFEQLPFDHPIYIMFSSGTTGKPKCMVQGVGVLINHLKELVIHTDLKRKDRICYITSPSWMMWNWLISSLAVGATVILYDGNPLYPDWGRMWELVQKEQISILGCSASYINYLMSIKAAPGKRYDLASLREISQTASPLSAEGMEWVYDHVKPDLHFNSISGGTDINGCFAAGSPTLPVYAGELQARGLGMRVFAYNEKGEPVFDQQAELICEAPSPSMPLYFWDDPHNIKYRAAYFDFYKSQNKNVWRHGDYIVINSKTGGVTFYGRSDAVLKPSGVRIGTAEIYNIVESLPEIVDSVAIGQNWKGDQRVILFVRLTEGQELNEDLKKKIVSELRTKGSPRHVPALILETPDIPYTFSGKKVEISIANIIHGRPVLNRDALQNPESLDYFEQIKDML
ncbi:MAG: acetoacetate--CoA ligase [Candidatus Heimdallarchaeota archaeon]